MDLAGLTFDDKFIFQATGTSMQQGNNSTEAGPFHYYDRAKFSKLILRCHVCGECWIHRQMTPDLVHEMNVRENVVCNHCSNVYIALATSRLQPDGKLLTPLQKDVIVRMWKLPPTTCDQWLHSCRFLMKKEVEKTPLT